MNESTNTLKICATSDTHGNPIIIPECDFFCHCGDWSPLYLQDNFVRMQSWLDAFIIDLCHLPCKYVVIIAGNHDLIMDSMLGHDIFMTTQYRLGLTRQVLDSYGTPVHECKVRYLDRTSVTLDGVTFWGSPVTKQINRWEKRWAFETNTPAYDIHSNADVVLTHQPSDYKGLGNTYWRMSEPSKRFGQRCLTEAINGSNAKLHLCGHIHTGNHSPVVYPNKVQTIGCNVSMLDEQYEPVYPVKSFILSRNQESGLQVLKTCLK